ncbi:hypothetical protein D3C76_1827820 [compost metagenome]
MQVDLHQAGGCDLVEQQTVGVDQKMMFRPRHTQGYVREDQVAHAKVRDQAVAGGQFLTQSLFGKGH